MALDATRTINGSFGEVWHEGKWLTNVQKAEANVEIDKEEVNRSGTRWTGHKVTKLTGTGTVSGYKITSDFIQLIGSVGSDKGKPYVSELIFKLADPESFGAERVRLKGVQFDKIPLGNFEVGKLVEEELPFTFSGYDLLDKIKEK
ncbi:phage tail tube protein [Fictibacillus sp. Mic-4]|uniref:phage tail tube protein n=1 Tax=Fictibacillus sp. Mic-4 TaxID=3132826 RepID=UPI003CE78144